MSPGNVREDGSTAGRRARVLAVAVALFVFAFVPRVIHPLATSACYDEMAAKDCGPIFELLKKGDFTSDQWAHYPHMIFPKYVFGLLPRALFGSDPMDPSDLVGARAMGALLGSGLVVMTFLVGLRCLPFGAALAGALLLATFPSVLGHDRIAMHDAPSRLLALVGWWLVLKAFTRPRCASDELTDGNRSGCPTGLDSPLRPSAFSLRPLLWGAAFFGWALTFYHRPATASGLAVAIFLLVRLMQRVRPRSSVGQAHQQPSIARKGDGGPPAGVSSAGGVLRTLALFGAVSLGTWILSAFLLWPYMWFRPWELIRWYADPLATAGGGGSIEFWFGRIRTVPWFYYLVAIAVSTPPLTLLASTGWQVAALWRPRSDEGRLPILLLVWIPLLVCSLTLRQGLTHYLQIMMPGLCLGAGAGAWRVGGWLAHRWKIPRRTATGSLVALMVLMHVYACWSVRPYFFEYFNSLVGGGGGVTRHRLFSQGVYGEAIQPLFDYVRTMGKSGSTVLCRLGPWPALSQLNRYLGPDLLLQGHQTIDPLGARYVLRVGLERFGEFYRYHPDPALYEKVYDVLCDGGSLGDVWQRKDTLAATGLIYADDFASPQFSRFAVGGQNINLNPFSDGKLYAVRGDQPAALLLRFPSGLLAGKRSVNVEADVQVREGGIRILAGNDPSQLREVAKAERFSGTVQGSEVSVKPGQDLFIGLVWGSDHRWNGNVRTFWESDWVDALRVYGK